MIHLIIITIVIILLFIACVYSYKYNEKQNKKAKILFYDKLIDICYNAKTKEECELAYETLIKDCTDYDIFTIPKAYHSKFYELRSVLIGKLSMFEK